MPSINAIQSLKIIYEITTKINENHLHPKSKPQIFNGYVPTHEVRNA